MTTYDIFWDSSRSHWSIIAKDENDDHWSIDLAGFGSEEQARRYVEALNLTERHEYSS